MASDSEEDSIMTSEWSSLDQKDAYFDTMLLDADMEGKLELAAIQQEFEIQMIWNRLGFLDRAIQWHILQFVPTTPSFWHFPQFTSRDQLDALNSLSEILHNTADSWFAECTGHTNWKQTDNAQRSTLIAMNVVPYLETKDFWAINRMREVLFIQQHRVLVRYADGTYMVIHPVKYFMQALMMKKKTHQLMAFPKRSKINGLCFLKSQEDWVVPTEDYFSPMFFPSVPHLLLQSDLWFHRHLYMSFNRPLANISVFVQPIQFL